MLVVELGRPINADPIQPAIGEVMGPDDRFWQACRSRGMQDYERIFTGFVKSLVIRIIRIGLVQKICN